MISELSNLRPNSKRWIEIPVGTSSNHIGAYLIRGRKDGPIVALAGGVHGDEYDGILAAADVGKLYEPQDIAGSLVVIPVANPIAFKAALRRTPTDGKDLNRVFPGSPNGSTTEQIADVLCTRLFKGADLVFTLHGSTADGVLCPWIEFYDAANELGRKTFAAAAHSGFPDLISLPRLPGVLQTALADMNVPTIEGEVGGRGATTVENVAYYTQRIRDVLTFMGNLPGVAIKAAETRIWELGQIVVQTTGVLVTSVQLGEDVEKGQQVGSVLDGLGKESERILAPAAGRIGGLRQHAGVEAGCRIATLWTSSAYAQN